MKPIKFYSLAKREYVDVPASHVTKKATERTLKSGAVQTRYSLVATVDGAKLTKFVSKGDYDAFASA